MYHIYILYYVYYVVHNISSALGRPAQQEGDLFKQLWAEEAEEVRLKQYSFMDEGPTVLVLLDLNEHLPLDQASEAAPRPTS